MIEGRPRESLVQYENPIEVNHIYLHRQEFNHFNRFPLAKIPRTLSRRPLVVSKSLDCVD